jgi:hypothetical protein
MGGGYLGSITVSAGSLIDLNDISTAEGQSLSYTVDTGLGYSEGTVVKIFNTDSTIPSDLNYIIGIVQSYSFSSGSITLYVSKRVGSASSASNWKINLAGEHGEMGATGPEGGVGGANTQLIYNNNNVADGAKVYFDNQNDFLGVNAEIPAAELDVVGNAIIRGNVTLENGEIDGAKSIAKAWVNFNGLNSTIRDSFNVSSVTDLGAGNYKVNLSNAIDSNAAAVATAHPNGPGLGQGSFNRMCCANMNSENEINITVWKDPGGLPNYIGVLTDAEVVSVMAFSSL